MNVGFKINPLSTQHPRIDQKMAHHISLRLSGMKLRKHSTRGPEMEVIHPNNKYYGLSQPQDVEESEKSESDEALPGSGIDYSVLVMDPGCDTASVGGIEALEFV